MGFRFWGGPAPGGPPAPRVFVISVDKPSRAISHEARALRVIFHSDCKTGRKHHRPQYLRVRQTFAACFPGETRGLSHEGWRQRILSDPDPLHLFLLSKKVSSRSLVIDPSGKACHTMDSFVKMSQTQTDTLTLQAECVGCAQYK